MFDSPGVRPTDALDAEELDLQEPVIHVGLGLHPHADLEASLLALDHSNGNSLGLPGGQGRVTQPGGRNRPDSASKVPGNSIQEVPVVGRPGRRGQDQEVKKTHPKPAGFIQGLLHGKQHLPDRIEREFNRPPAFHHSRVRLRQPGLNVLEHATTALVDRQGDSFYGFDPGWSGAFCGPRNGTRARLSGRGGSRPRRGMQGGKSFLKRTSGETQMPAKASYTADQETVGKADARRIAPPGRSRVGDRPGECHETGCVGSAQRIGPSPPGSMARKRIRFPRV